jgi:hypothetical protein
MQFALLCCITEGTGPTVSDDFTHFILPYVSLLQKKTALRKNVKLFFLAFHCIFIFLESVSNKSCET